MDSEVIVIAVDARKELTDYALEWAVRNVTKPGDSVIILAVLSCHERPSTSAKRTNDFLSCLLRKWGLGYRQKVKNNPSDINGFNKAVQQDSLQQINNVCVQMMRQLCLAHNKQVRAKVKVVASAQPGSVAFEARELEATWVILDRRLKKEGDSCLKQLTCSIVIMDHAIPKLLRAVNPLAGKRLSESIKQNDQKMLPISTGNYNSAKPRSSLGTASTIFDTDPAMSWSSPAKEQYDKSSSPSSIFNFKCDNPILHLNSDHFHQEVEVQTIFSPSPSYGKSKPPNKSSSLNIGDSPRKSSAGLLDVKMKSYDGLLKTKYDMEKVTSIKPTKMVSIPARRSTDSPRLLRNPDIPKENTAFPSSPILQRTSSIRKAMSLSIKRPPPPPPLCSICKHNAPTLGKALRKFSYGEIEVATDGFSSDKILADGGYGLVYKGVLPDGQVVAVKKHKTINAQGASEFCSEVEILSCAQHRNLVMLVGYCIEIELLLVYEFACNGSLDKHLYGTETNEVMAWRNRMKVAIGAARALRYLHEDCRVGCIVHRDFRPNNILLTHDFDPMVGDFGLARWQADGQSAEETCVIGAFGYLAPEYTETGLITEKADVYAFGVVLLELLSGIKATNFLRITGQQSVQEWGCLLLERKVIHKIIDPRLKGNYEENEVECMMYAARLCISPNPEKRPRMSKVLKILEGDISTDMACNNSKHSRSYMKQHVNNIFDTDSPMIPPVDNSPSSLLRQSIHDMNLSPSRTSVDSNNGRNSAFKKLALSKQYRTARCVEESDQPESNFSKEYEAYLQGSLAKFIQNFKGIEQL